jgi:hypothetical protein
MSCDRRCFEPSGNYFEHDDCSTCPGRDDGPSATPIKFAVLKLHDLKICKFQHEDELMEAIRALKTRSIGCVPLVWNEGAKTYTVPEVCE